MKIQKTILDETRNVAVGTLLLSVLMVVVFALLKLFSGGVIIGAVIGTIAAVLDFFLLGLTVQKAAAMQAAHPLPPEPEKDEEQEHESETGSFSDEAKQVPADPETAAAIKKHVQLSYFLRRAMLIAFACLGLIPGVSLAATVIPMLFPKFVIMVRNALISIKAKG